MRKEGVVLEDRVDVALVCGQARDIASAENDASGGRLLEARNHPQAGRLAATRRSEQGEELAFPNLQVDPGHRDHIAEGLTYAFQADLGGDRSRPWRANGYRSLPLLPLNSYVDRS